MTRIGILSDTHGYMDSRIVEYLKHCEQVWHAGDIGSAETLVPLAALVEVRAVYGNIDGGDVRKLYPEWQSFTVEGMKVCMTHIAGTPGKYTPSVRQKLADEKADILVCGHSHICLVKRDPAASVLHINPGAAGRHGFHKVRTLVRLTIHGKAIENMELVELGSRSG